MTARFLYAHGFASGPQSTKGRALAAHFAAGGRGLQLLDLRVPDRNRLRLSAMIEVVRSAIGEGERAIAIGSSLGGLTCARAAERDARIVGVFLIAPAFRINERWPTRMGKEQWARWEREGVMPFPDYAIKGGTLDVDFGFIEDAGRVDGDGFPDLRVPTVIVHGQRDETVDPELSRTFARGRSNVKLIELDDDHQMIASIPTISRELDAFIDSL